MKLFNDKKTFIILGSLVLVIGVIITFFVFNGNNDIYSQKEINNLKLNSVAMEKVGKYDLKQEYLVNYLKDFMEQYNYAYKNQKIIELTSKGKTFNDYFSKLLGKGEDIALNDTKDAYEIYRQHLLFVSDFFELSKIDAEAKVSKLKYNTKLLTNDEPKLIIDDNYYQYLEDVKTQIDYLLDKYFK